MGTNTDTMNTTARYKDLSEAAQNIMDDAMMDLDNVPNTVDRPAYRQRLNNAADTICRTDIEQAELRERITAEDAETLRDMVHEYAGSLHEVR
jgi:hypothetical protein